MPRCIKATVVFAAMAGLSEGLISLNRRAPMPSPLFAVSILKGGSVPVQSIPNDYIFSLPHWHLDAKARLERLQTEALDGGWVNPYSLDQFWVPEKIPEPKARLALSALVKDGMLRCVSPALDSFARAESTLWRNWGLCSVPLATVWLDYAFIPLQSLRLSAYATEEPDIIGMPRKKQLQKWKTLHEGIDIQPAINALIELIADPPPEILTGFHIVTVPLCDVEVSLPGDDTEVRVFLTEYPEPIKLVDLAGIDAGAGLLSFTAKAVASGKDSEYLPEAYRPLFS